MYCALPFRLERKQVEQCAQLADALNLTPGPGGSTASGRALTENIFRPLLDAVIQGTWTGAMVMALWPSSQLVAHCDPPIKGIRHHIPIRLNPRCWVFHDGVWQQLEEGQAYQMDPAQLHGAVNWGTAIRYHLVIDADI